MDSNRYLGTNYQLVHLKKSKYDVPIDRSTIWGNPFVLKKEEDRKLVVSQYKDYLLDQLKQKQLNIFDLIDTKNKILKEELRPLVLGCWCYPKLCHGDVLANVADQIEEATTPIKWACIVSENLDKDFIYKHLDKCLKYLLPQKQLGVIPIQVLAPFPQSVQSNINQYCIDRNLPIKYFISQTRFGAQADELRYYDIINKATAITVISKVKEKNNYLHQLIDCKNLKKSFVYV